MVTNTNASGAGSLSQAIVSANATPNSTIQLNNNLGTITLTSTLPVLTANMTIDGGTGNTITGNGAAPLLSISSGNILLSNFPLLGSPGGGGSNGGSADGSGGSGAGIGGNGGNGGVGGTDIAISGGTITLTNDGTISGGNGGGGGSGGSANHTGGGGGGAGRGGAGGNGSAGATGITISGGLVTQINNGIISGGSGGQGGNGGSASSSGGGGGAGIAGSGANGGAGATGISISGGTITLTNDGTISGGNGGGGGSGGSANAGGGGGGGGRGGNGGNGGAGGRGMTISAGTVTLTNNGTISGGNAGQGGIGGSANGGGGGGGNGNVGNDGSGGIGGIAISFAVGSGTVINGGTISGGKANGGLGAQADAIDFTGSNNELELEAGSTINGNVIVQSPGTNNTLALGGTTNSSFNVSTIGTQYQGFGNFQKIGTSTWTLTGTTTAVTSWIITQGTLEVSSDTNLGNTSGGITLSGGELLTSQNGFSTNRSITLNAGTDTLAAVTGMTATYSGAISGSGPLTIGDGNNSGRVVLTHANTYGGATTINGGTLAIGAGGSIAASSGVNLANSGTTFDISTGGNQTVQDLTGVINSTVILGANTLTEGTSNSTSFAGVIQGTDGSLIKQGTGTLTLTGASTYSGGTTISAGVLVLGNGVTAGATLGSGDVTVNGGGTLTLNLANNETFANNITDNNLVILDDSPTSNYTVSSSISGSGSVTKSGTNTVTLTGNNSYHGGTTINEGVLLLGNGVTAGTSLGSGDVTVNGGGTLTLNLANNETFANNITDDNLVILDDSPTSNYIVSSIITGSGSVTKSGTNTITLTGNNSYGGGTTISAGTLVIANASALGTGLVTQGGGTLETDNVNHVITMGNGFNQTAGMLILNFNGVPGATSNDQVNVTGTAKLKGSLQINYTAGKLAPFQSETYTAITTTGGITDINTAGYEPPALQAGALLIKIVGAVNGNDFDVTLTGKQTAFTTLSGTNFTGNQQNFVSYLDGFDTTISSGPIIKLLQALDGVSVNPNALGPAFDQLTPLKFENFTSSIAFNNTSFSIQEFDNYLANHRGVDGTFVSSNGNIDYSGLTVNDPNIDSSLQMIHSRLLAWNPAPSMGLLSDMPESILGGVDMKESKTMVNPEPIDPWNVFISGNVMLAQDFSDPAAGTSHIDATTGAVQIGADYRITPNFLVGVTFGYGHTDATLDTLGSTASVDTYSPGVYASYSNSGWYANALGSYGFANYDQDRKVAIGAFNGTAHSSPGGDQIIGNLDGGYDFHQGHWTFGPTVGMQYVHLDVDGFTETGLPGADLSVNQNESDSLRSRFGGRISYSVQDGDLIFTPHFSASWQHEFLDQSRGITSQFDGIGAGSFVVKTANPSRDSALVDVGLDAQMDKTWTVFADYTVQAGQSNYFGQSVQAGVKIGF